MITTSDTIVIEDNVKVQYVAPDITTFPTRNPDGSIRCFCTATVTAGPNGSFVIDYSEATLNALTPSGSTTTEKFLNVCEQAVKATLLAYTGNGGITLTIV